MAQKIFLTGASAGIGRAAALALCEAGHEVWGTSRRLDRLPTHERFHAVVVDLLDAEKTDAVFRRAELESGGFDVLINNAGAGIFAPVEAQSDDLVQRQFRLLFYAPLQLIQLALPRMRTRNAGRIVNVTSLAARLPIPFLGIYSAAKAAMSSASETLRHELCHTRIRLVDIQPGDIRTEFHDVTERRDLGWEDAYHPALKNAWDTIDHNMKQAPETSCVVAVILRAVQAVRPAPVLVAGGFFEARVAPFGLRILPKALMEWAIQRFYKL